LISPKKGYYTTDQHAGGVVGAAPPAARRHPPPPTPAAGADGGGGGAGDGGDRVRRLDGGRREQQRGADGGAEQLPALWPRLPGPPRHWALLQWPPRHRLLLRGLRPPPLRPGLPRPGLRHPGLRHRRLLRFRGLRPRRHHRRRLLGDPAVEASRLLPGVQAAAGGAPGRGGGGGGGVGCGVRHQHGHQRLHRELLRGDDAAVPAVRGGRVHRLPGGPRPWPPRGALRPRRAQGRLHGARRRGLPPAGPRPPHDVLRRGVQRRGQGLQRRAPRHDRRARRRPARRAAPLRRRLRLLRRHPRRPGTIPGFVKAEVGCCGTGTYEMGYTCSAWDARTCRDADRYVFWDAVHPTEQANRIIAEYLFNTTFSHFL
ncbi:hypothetical protein EE612_011148, partial [Oryza sativa]